MQLEGAIDYSFYNKTQGISVRSIKMLFWTEEAYNSLDVLTPENATMIKEMEWVPSESRYEATYVGLAAKDMFSPIYSCAVVEDVDGNVYYGGVLAFCPERFGYINMNSAVIKDKNLARALVVYGDAARTYFANN